jgi:hypothetical protein
MVSNSVGGCKEKRARANEGRGGRFLQKNVCGLVKEKLEKGTTIFL